MTRFLTDASELQQLQKKKRYKLLKNELYLDDDGSIYLAWRNYITDNFTWLDSDGYDTRCSHIHDIGCQYHQLVRVCLSYDNLRSERLLCKCKGKLICEDIPTKYLEVIDVTGHEINNLFYRMLRDADCPKTPKIAQLLYRGGVSLNLHWFLTGKEKIDLNKIYKQ